MARPISDLQTATILPASSWVPFLDTTESNAAEKIKRLNSDAIVQSAPVTLVDAATIAWDASTGNVAAISTATSGRTLAAPTNLRTAGRYMLRLTNTIGTGAAIAFIANSVFKNINGSAMSLITVADGATLTLEFYSPNGTDLHLVTPVTMPGLLTEAATVTWDGVANGNCASLALTATGRTLGAISNPVSGMAYSIVIVNGAGVAAALNFNTNYSDADGNDMPTVTIPTGELRAYTWIYNGLKMILVGDVGKYVGTVTAPGSWTTASSDSVITVTASVHGRGVNPIVQFMNDDTTPLAGQVNEGATVIEKYVGTNGDVTLVALGVAPSGAPSGRLVIA